MSLIASYINKFGIVLASDSNLSRSHGNAGFGQKIFPIQHLNAGLAYSGSYEIDGKTVDQWMSEFIAGSFFINSTISEFVTSLSDELSRVMRDDDFDQGNIIHVAGYSQSDGTSSLEHWHISNMGLQPDGLYSPPVRRFHYSNDFNSKTVQRDREILIMLDQDSINNQFYINGYPPGRISAMTLKSILERVFLDIWSNQNWLFKKPSNLFESSSIVKICYYLVAELFKMSDHNALFIGGETQTYLIAVPQNLDKSNWA